MELLNDWYSGFNHIIKLSDPTPSNGENYAAWQQSLSSVLNDLYNGKIKPEDLNQDLFFHNKNNLLNSAGEGLRKDLIKISFDDPDYTMLSKMKRSIYAFSGAKTYQQLKQMNSLLYDHKGKLLDFEVFKTNVRAFVLNSKDIDKAFNRNLKAEYEQARRSGEMARQWNTYQEHSTIPNLKYITAGDENVRAGHAILDGLVLPKTDPFWKRAFPPNGWNCRCDVIETDESVTVDTSADFLPDRGFDFNPGIHGSAFSPNHPYYTKYKKDRERIEKRTDEFGLKEHIEINKKIYNQYTGDENYVQVSFDNKSGGFIVKHKNSENYKEKEWAIIKELQERGERIVLPEKLRNINYQKHFDLLLNESSFDLKVITGNKDRIVQRIEEGSLQANNIVVVFTSAIVREEIIRQISHVRLEGFNFNALYIKYNGNWSLVTKKEIKSLDYSALH